MSDTSQATASSEERAVEQITLLMPVWGYQFIGRFLEFCLPTLLAPNNIPAIAQALPCRFVLLSSATDEPVIRSHPAWQKLERHCACEIQSIDDLITQGNHTATITLAFERVLRQCGSAMRKTCFIFLMSDYLVADGSLKTVLETVRQGASAVLAGNFQIIAEEAVPLLRQHIDLASHEIVLRPRDLVRWALAHLHPATMANIVNFGLTHNAHTNRLFWRVDEETLVGRFYLMHPIAIHPQAAGFDVEASWDYSFVPELGRSGKVVALTDSDNYLVVELQQRNYEWENLRSGPVTAAALARSLAEWTTEEHRRNVAHTVVFHAADHPANLAPVVAQSDAFIDSVRRLLTAPPLHHQRHPYWLGSIAVNRDRTHRPLGKDDWSFLLGQAASGPRSALQRARAKLFGFPPGVTTLHPLWPDYKLPLKALDDIMAAKGRVLLIAHDAEPFAQWVVSAPGDVVTLNADHLLQMTRLHYDTLAGTFDACLLFSGDGIIEQSDALIEHVGPLLKANGRIIVMVANSLAAEDATAFGRTFASHAGRLLNQSVWVEDIHYVGLSPRRLALRAALLRLAAISAENPYIAPVALPVALAIRFANVSAYIGSTPPLGAWSSVCLTLRAAEEAAPYPPRFARQTTLDGLPALKRPARPTVAEPVQATSPLLAAPTGRLWQDEPDQLKTHLAHYRFIAAMMDIRHDVAEYGCASALGTRLVLRQFRRLTVFDPRPFAVGDLQWRFQDNWRFEARQHNILAATLPRQVDSAYCVDFIQYVSRDEEDIFVRNLKDSLFHESDFLLIGSPSYAFGGEALPVIAAQSNLKEPPCRSAERHSTAAETRIHRRSGAELKALMERFFQNVFMFSMIDDVAQPGIHSDAKHVFALGCGKKD